MENAVSFFKSKIKMYAVTGQIAKTARWLSVNVKCNKNENEVDNPSVVIFFRVI